MLVRDLIAKLSEEDPEAEVHVPSIASYDGLTEADEVYATTTQYGILTDHPRTVRVVAIDYSTRGLG